MGIALDGCQTAAALFKFERVAVAGFDNNNIWYPGPNTHTLKDRGFDAGTPSAVRGTECEHRRRGPERQMLEYGALYLLFRPCSTWSAIHAGRIFHATGRAYLGTVIINEREAGGLPIYLGEYSATAVTTRHNVYPILASVAR
jgi:hypothetical protein